MKFMVIGGGGLFVWIALAPASSGTQGGSGVVYYVARIWADLLGIAISNFLNLSLVDVIILGGERLQKNPTFFQMVKKGIEKNSLSHSKEKIRVEQDTMEPWSILIGTVARVFELFVQ